jgi:hypothetical protein
MPFGSALPCRLRPQAPTVHAAVPWTAGVQLDSTSTCICGSTRGLLSIGTVPSGCACCSNPASLPSSLQFLAVLIAYLAYSFTSWDAQTQPGLVLSIVGVFVLSLCVLVGTECIRSPASVVQQHVPLVSALVPPPDLVPADMGFPLLAIVGDTPGLWSWRASHASASQCVWFSLPSRTRCVVRCGSVCLECIQ